MVRELLGQLFWQLTIRIAKWGFALAATFVLWGVAQDAGLPSSRTVPAYVCFDGRTCERVIRVVPDSPRHPGQQEEQAQDREWN